MSRWEFDGLQYARIEKEILKMEEWGITPVVWHFTEI
jgi:hypothetical protein